MAEQIGLDRAQFRPSYRPERAPSGLDPDMKRMGLLAIAMGGVVALFAGGSMLMRPGHHAVPVIEPEAGPVRIKPENPGGMQVSGADMTAPGVDQGPHLAPAAEQPELANLRKQVHQVERQLAKQAAENALLAKQSAANTQLAKLAAANAAHPKLVAAAPPVQQATATAHVTVPATPAPPLPPHAGNAPGSNVQLAAFVDEPAARAEWEALTKRVPELLGGRQPEISRTDAGGRTMYRLRTGGFGTVADAASFCEKMKAHGEECSIGAF